MAHVPEDAELLFLGHCFARLRERVNAWCECSNYLLY
jgi:hypothetical protein